MQRVQQLLSQEVTAGHTPGLQYLHFSPSAILYRYHGGVARVAGQLPVDDRTTFNGFSVTKTFTAVALLQLVERGVIRLDEGAATYLPSFPYSHDITVRHLLTHTAGIPNPIPLRWIHLENEHATFNRNAFFASQYAKYRKVNARPNEKSSYSNLGFELLGEIIERVTGASYEAYVTQNILDRIGLTPRELGFALDPAVHARGYHKRVSVSYPFLGFLMDKPRAFEGREGAWQLFRRYYMNGAAYGGLIGTADGFARYLQALMNASRELLSASSKEQLFSEHMLNDGRHSGMGLSWFRGALDGEAYVNHAGGGGGYYAELRIYPRLERGSVVLMNRTGMTNVHFLDKVDCYFTRDGSLA